MTAFTAKRTVRFSQCDAAGIIFYPRYFELVHEVTEDWFCVALDLPYSRLMFKLRRGFPMLKLVARFSAPSQLGDLLDISLIVKHVGATSLHLDYDVECCGVRRAYISSVVVQTVLETGRPMKIDGDLRARLEHNGSDTT